MWNLLRSGLNVTLVKSDLLSLIMVLPDFPMLDDQVCAVVVRGGGGGGGLEERERERGKWRALR